MTFAGGLSDDIRGRDTSRPPSPQKSWMNGMRGYRGENETNAIGLPVHSTDLLAHGGCRSTIMQLKKYDEAMVKSKLWIKNKDAQFYAPIDKNITLHSCFLPTTRIYYPQYQHISQDSPSQALLFWAR